MRRAFRASPRRRCGRRCGAISRPAWPARISRTISSSVPAPFVWIGNGKLRDGAELHGPRYDFNDAVLPVASTWMAEVAKAALASN